MVQLLNSIYLGAATPSDYGKAAGVVELLPFDYYLGAAVPSHGKPTVDVLLSGVSPLTLLNAVSLNYVKAFGKCEQASTPTPASPVDIVANNGAIKVKDDELPVGYKRLSYIESSGAQIIDTNYVLQETDSVEVDYNITNRSRTGDKFILCAQQIVDGINIAMWVETYGAQNSWYVRFGSPSSVNTTSTTSQLSGTFKVSKGSFVVNRVKILQPAYNAMPSNQMSIFNRRRASDGSVTTAGCSAQVRSVRILNGNNIIRKYIPCESPDNILGLYEVTQGEFLTNNGSGNFTAGSYDTSHLTEIYYDGSVETVSIDTTLSSATCQPLLSVGTYKDVQNITNGAITRNVGVKVFDGTEDWAAHTVVGTYRYRLEGKLLEKSLFYSTHFVYSSATSTGLTDGEMMCGAASQNIYVCKTDMTTLDDFKAWLASQQAAGTPMVVVYPLATPTTETVTGQTLTITQGTNVVTAEGSVSDLELEVSYKAYAEVTVEEIEAVNTDENVEVIIS